MHTGFLEPNITVISPTATSVTVNWTQPEHSRTVAVYFVTLRIKDTTLCFDYTEPDQATTTQPDINSATFIGLQEYSTYTVTIIANFVIVSYSMSSSRDFTTLMAGKRKQHVLNIISVLPATQSNHAGLCSIAKGEGAIPYSAKFSRPCGFCGFGLICENIIHELNHTPQQ